MGTSLAGGLELQEGNALGIDVVGDLAYVGADGAGLRIINVSTPQDPSEVGHSENAPYGGSAYDVKVVGNGAYVAQGTCLARHNVHTPHAPYLEAYLQKSAEDLDVTNGDAYPAGYEDGLRVLNPNNADGILETYLHDTPGDAHGVRVNENMACVADMSGGLRIIDVSQPLEVFEVSNLPIAGSARRVDVVGTMVYVAAMTGGLRIINASIPAEPVAVGAHEDDGSMWNVHVVGDLAYLAALSGGLRIINVHNPTSPVEVGYYETPESAWDLKIVEDKAYIADHSAGLTIIHLDLPCDDGDPCTSDTCDPLTGCANTPVECGGD